MSSDVTVVIPSIPPRESQLRRAIDSVEKQTILPTDLIVEIDSEKTGAAATRNRALDNVTTKWVAFLDDDDMFYPQHIETLLSYANDRDADLVYPWFDMVGRSDPLAVPVNGKLVHPLGVEFSEEQRQFVLNVANFIPVTHLCRTDMVKEVGCFPIPETEEWPDAINEDWGFLKRMLNNDARFVHAPVRTWVWNHWTHNTSGSPNRW